MEKRFVLSHSKSTFDINHRERIQRKQSIKKIKFKQIKPESDFSLNQLNSKFNLYQNGTPNNYNYSVQAFKAGSILNQLNIVDSPFLDNVINQLKEPKQKSLNRRDYEMYPNLLAKSYKYKDMLSDKQQIKDFLHWFQASFQKIEGKEQSNIKKFNEKQLLISAGFNQIIKQVSKLSRPRGQILKMLWNRQNTETKSIIQLLSSYNMKYQKQYLQNCSQIHTSYQEQIQKLKRENSQLLNKNEQLNIMLNGHINSLRCNKKTLKKYQIMVKKIFEINLNLSKQNLNMLEENTKLLIEGKQVSAHEAKILQYRRLQLNQKRSNIKKTSKKQMIDHIRRESQAQTLQSKIIDLEQKKQKLLNYFKQRMDKFPDQKRYVQQEYFYDESFSNFEQIQRFLKKIINSKQIQYALVNEVRQQNQQLFKQVGINTLKDQSNDQQQKPFYLNFDKSVQADIPLKQNGNQLSMRSAFSDRQNHQKFGIIGCADQNLWSQCSKKKIRQSKMNVRNSLMVLQLQKISMFKHHKQTSTTSNSSRKSRVSKRETIKEKLSGFSPLKQEFTKIGKTAKKNQMQSSPDIIVQQNQSHLLNEYNNQSQIKVQAQENRQSIQSNGQSICDKDRQILDQLSNLMQKYLTKANIQKIPSDPQKHLTKILNSVWKSYLNYNEILKQNRVCHSFAQNLLLAVKTHHNQSKGYLHKFLSLLAIIKHHQSHNDLLQLVSLFLNLNSKFCQYEDVNCEDIPIVYFSLFTSLHIKKQKEDALNLWNCCTSLQKLKQQTFVKELSKYFSKSKITYIQIKIEEFINLNKLHSGTKIKTSRENISSPHSMRNNSNSIQNDQDVIISLNSVLLYILQVYLIQKKNYKNSYKNLVPFLSQNGKIKQEQLEILKFIVNMKKQTSNMLNERRDNRLQLRVDDFYRICVKTEQPLFQELVFAVHRDFKLIQKKARNEFEMTIGSQEWPYVKVKLQKDCIKNKTCNLMIQKLQRIIFMKPAQGKAQIFSLMYQILIMNCLKSEQTKFE